MTTGNPKSASAPLTASEARRLALLFAADFAHRSRRIVGATDEENALLNAALEGLAAEWEQAAAALGDDPKAALDTEPDEQEG